MTIVNYDDRDIYENPPNVTDAPGYESHTLSTEEFDEKATVAVESFGLPIKEAIMASHEKKEDGTRKVTASSIFTMIIYAIFLALVTYVALAQCSVQTYYFTKIIGDLFVTSKSAATNKVFTEISSMDDIWGFLQGSFLVSLYQTDAPSDVEKEAMVYYNNRLLGKPRIRMVKVTNNSCTVAKSFAREILECYSNFDPSVEDKHSFGPATSEPYVWQSAEKLLTETIYGTISSYPGGGFVLRLPVDSSNEASKLIQDAKSNRWIDRSTRAIIIDFAMFNANVNLFCIASLLLELPASGGVLPSYRFSAFDLMRYLGTAGTVMIVFEGILCGFIAYYIILEFMELFRVRLGYFFNFWNIVDIILLSLCCIEIYLNYNRSKVAADRVNEVLQNGLTDAAFDDVITTQENFNNIAAVILFLSWIKVFNYIGVNKTMNQLAATLSRSTKDIGGFAVMFAVFFFAYAQFGYLVFGTQIADYSTFYNAVFALLRTILGDFNFNALERTNRILGPVFFITYVFFVFFVLLNMFLAIINDSYVEVKAELARQQDGEGIFDWIRKKLTRRGSNNEKIATYNDYKTNLMMAGYNEKDINHAFEKLEIKFTDKVDDNALIEVGNEIREQRNRKKVIDEEYRSITVLTHRIDMMDRTILGVVDKMSKVLDQLNRIEHSRVQALEHQNRLRAEAMMMKAVRRGEVDEYSDGEREKNRFEE
ncbi:hypothetical protein RB195_002020 [Necator americanus]|uniref:Polycystin cation channel PKD1/PKD2 domain-containing protein n=1 Tax=Necator americanus TaxID=51031 RepID=A0ABR1DH07_NECAM